MKRVLLFVMTFVIVGWSIPKPMESVTNYNVMMVYGTYGFDKLTVYSALLRGLSVIPLLR